MNVILVQSVIGLGRAGETVSVKPGYARNWLVPTGIAVHANAENQAVVEAKRAEMEKEDAKLRKEANKVAEKLEALTLTLKVEVNDEGNMFGTVGVSELHKLLQAEDLNIERKCINIAQPFESLGTHEFSVQCHVDVSAKMKVLIEG
ncbi:50S ribosomal protein L9 [Candidatus Comchoanobacter bicostacola]|uniref:Large ribosomal subunit protein bL9 n=1 Tax=Candidatus Comchoanobacter bicostacola TaxID=2919598 RepID=A0ABY5DL00_9GAMM|nr:50S ribosomal protein L9 [Candidatus Comchoanobacter bicostacola]UTC24815.1 50S ribosomal protein L9 [Candidatus Comchoanobacter bicostacola]